MSTAIVGASMLLGEWFKVAELRDDDFLVDEGQVRLHVPGCGRQQQATTGSVAARPQAVEVAKFP
nr:hypothetical protein GCM10020063_057750 [Dactylosporangium thailandense]